MKTRVGEEIGVLRKGAIFGEARNVVHVLRNEAKLEV